MDKITIFKHKRKTISLSGRSGFIGTQSVVFSPNKDGSIPGLNKDGNRRGMSLKSQLNLNEGAKPGFGISSQRNLRKCVDIFYWGCKRSRGLNPITRKNRFMAAAFITLTIPDMHEVIDSKRGYEKLLKKYIKWMIRLFGVESYIWKFEWQERGQGHWHIFADKFCPVGLMRKEWLSVLDKSGLLDDWKKTHSYDAHYCCKIKGLKDEKQVWEYLEKYMSKSSQNQQATEGRAWGASIWIKKSKKITLPVTDKFCKTLEIAVQVKAFNKQDIKVPELSIEGLPMYSEDGSTRELLIGSVFWSDKWRVEVLLCPLQLKYYNAYIDAYRAKDWEMTHRLSYDIDKISSDFKTWTESKEYLEMVESRRKADYRPNRRHIRAKLGKLNRQSESQMEIW